MNDKDKEAFEYWKLNFTGERISILSKMSWEQIIKNVMSEAWQAACEYKQKEIDDLNKAVEFFALENTHYFESLENLEAENTKLKREIEVLRQYGNKDCTAMADEVLDNE